MDKRKGLEKLVFGVLKIENYPITARELFEELKENHHEILIQHRIWSIKSFVQIIRTFNVVKSEGIGIKRYKNRNL